MGGFYFILNISLSIGHMSGIILSVGFKCVISQDEC